jgi:hypothetical protein
MSNRSWVLYLNKGKLHHNSTFNDDQHDMDCRPTSWLLQQVEQLRREVMHAVESGEDHGKTQNIVGELLLHAIR